VSGTQGATAYRLHAVHYTTAPTYKGSAERGT
jgi:hypothetical protein